MQHIPQRDNLLVLLVDTDDDRTPSGLYLAEHQRSNYKVGQVVRAGEGYLNGHGVKVTHEYKEKDLVGFKAHDLLPQLNENGQRHYLVPAAEILTRVVL